jgi:hypothetical protein
VADPAAIRRLTDCLLGSPAAVDVDTVRRAVDPMPAELAALAARASGTAGVGPRRRRGGQIRLTGHDVRVALGGGTAVGAARPEPFAWSLRTSRRALGVTAVRSLLAGDVRSPDEGVRAAVAQAIRAARTGQRPLTSMDRWLAEISPAARAAVGAEAITWATRLWCALDWEAFEGRPVIGRDHWWDSPRPSLLALRSRAEVRTGNVHLVVLEGMRRSTVRAELSVVVLIETLRSRPLRAPGRIVGWWPDSGHIVQVDVDPSALERGVAAVARTLSGDEKRAAA